MNLAFLYKLFDDEIINNYIEGNFHIFSTFPWKQLAGMLN